MASLTLSPTVTPVASTSVTCTLPNPFPPGVAGSFIAYGANAASFAFSNNGNLIAVRNGLLDGSYSVTITATP